MGQTQYFWGQYSMSFPGGKYLHYKNMPYRAQGVARHSETGEELVIYETLYHSDGGRIWARPKPMWDETVEVDGAVRPRFGLQTELQVQAVDGQLQAYNEKNLAGFLTYFSEDISVYIMGQPDPVISGRKEFEASYKKLFAESPKLKCVVDRRLVIGATVIDEEILYGHPKGDFIKVAAIYYIEQGKIVSVHFATT